MRNILTIATFLPLAACATMSPKTSGSSDLAGAESLTESRTAALFAVDTANPTGPLSLYGTAVLSVTGDRAELIVDTVLPGRAEYGMHLHSVGKCEAPDFATAGPHWNPLSKQHGRDNPAGMHHGDLPNIKATETSGSLARAALKTSVSLEAGLSPFDADGVALVIHEKADDYSTDPSGNSGKRIICGVFTEK